MPVSHSQSQGSRNKSFKKKTSIAKGRPPTAHKQLPSLSKKVTQKRIRSQHEFNKKIAEAKATGNGDQVAKLERSVEELGGLKAYQLASIQGQANDRGGDSSIVLMKWLKDIKPIASSKVKLRLLEVGALSTKNAISKSGLFDITRIDLNSQTEGIIQQDFMERPIPQYESNQFDIISLSLVLNFVPLPKSRGDMLNRTCQFLDQRAPRSMPAGLQSTFPALFLVLPAACIVNSRWMSDERLTLMMASLGYVILARKQTEKLVYYLWQLRDRPTVDEQDFQKTEVNPGGGRNNFSIVLHGSSEKDSPETRGVDG